VEYLADLVTNVPDGTADNEVEEIRAAENGRAAELAAVGYLLRLWIRDTDSRRYNAEPVRL
jgi:muconolactone D-isomerase